MHEKSLALEPTRLEKLIARLANEWRKASTRGQDVALLADTVLRRPLRQALSRALPDLAVIAYQEVPVDLLLEPVAMVKPEDIGTPGAEDNLGTLMGDVGEVWVGATESRRSWKVIVMPAFDGLIR